MSRRWRPSLAFVLGGALAGTLALSFTGLVALRYLGPAVGFRTAAVVLALAISAGTAGLGWLLLRLLLRPIQALEAYAQAREKGAPASPPAHFGTRETATTAVRVIAMAEALQDREATIRAFTDHVTHELKTPVAAIRAATELLEDGGGLGPDDARLLSQIDSARAQLEAQLAALRRAAQAREMRHLGHSRLADLITDLSADFPALDIATEGASLRLPLAAEGLRIALAQLLRNAADHGAKRVTLAASATEAGPVLEIADDGSGIAAGNAGRIFDPFFTTRRETGGTGMGLAIVRNLLNAHRAEILLCDGPATRFRITFDAGVAH
ncbi:sensor histidine kinase [Thioclava atlantica]|uniref:histidine kinase n=1 Tax=Thioclava atlantica TaxID=1317124 RepID=A0A085TRB4_9RHOB|nr:HAMP domain-containing sensor histidine kinase [Thioclava atlantica]KFE33261.1 two component signal transduction histidine kinase [Thioclava atlantica]